MRILILETFGAQLREIHMQYRQVCKYIYNCDPCIEVCVVYCIALYVLICQIPICLIWWQPHILYLRVGFTVQLSSLTVQLQSLIVQLYQASLHIVTDQLKLS